MPERRLGLAFQLDPSRAFHPDRPEMRGLLFGSVLRPILTRLRALFDATATGCFEASKMDNPSFW